MIVNEEGYLEHHGVKGMRWGVINEDKTGSNKTGASKDEAGSNKIGASKDKTNLSKAGTPNDQVDYLKIKNEYLSIIKTNNTNPTKIVDQATNLIDNSKKFSQKFGPEPKKDAVVNQDEKGWRPTSGQVKTVLIGAAFVGLVVYGAKADHKLISSLPRPGEKIEAKQFQKAVSLSKRKSWVQPDGKGFIQESSFLQEEFTLPVGHVFRRISTREEDSFRQATYATSNLSDFNRYVAGFRQEKGPGAKFYETTFKATQEIKVPSLTKTLDVFHAAANEKQIGPTPYTREETMKMFTKMSGGAWNDPIAERFFKRLSDEGYSAIVDQMDAGVIGDAPLVLFNSANVGHKQSKPMTSKMISAAESSLTELANRKT